MSAAKTSSAVRHKVIIDVDTGVDDAQAIVLALSSPDIEVMAITCVNGNLEIDEVVANTLRTVQACDRTDIPVYKGATRALHGEVHGIMYHVHRAGAAWKEPVDLNLLQSEHAANALVRIVNQFPGEITLILLGPLTNIAVALNLDPDFHEKVKDTFIMGGNIEARGVNPCAEFNFFIDPVAAFAVLHTLKNIRIVPYEVCNRAAVPMDFVERWTRGSSKKSRFLRECLGFDPTTAKKDGRKEYITWDAFTMATIMDPSVVTKEEVHHATVELSGVLTRGQMVVDWRGILKKEPNVTIIMEMDVAKIQQQMLLASE